MPWPLIVQSDADVELDTASAVPVNVIGVAMAPPERSIVSAEPVTTMLVMLSSESLQIIRTDPNGARRGVCLSPAWLNVQLQDRPGRVPSLLLVGRNIRHEIGRSLGETEKRAFAAALQEAVYRWRHPRFDNAQLDEMKKECSTHCLSTCNYILAHCYDTKRVLKWVAKQAMHGFKGSTDTIQ